MSLRRCLMPFRRSLVRRTATAAAIAAATLGGLTACDLFAPQDTLYIEEASVGVSATVGNVFVGNGSAVRRLLKRLSARLAAAL